MSELYVHHGQLPELADTTIGHAGRKIALSQDSVAEFGRMGGEDWTDQHFSAASEHARKGHLETEDNARWQEALGRASHVVNEDVLQMGTQVRGLIAGLG